MTIETIMPYRDHRIIFTNTGARGFHFTIRDAGDYVIHEFPTHDFKPSRGVEACQQWIDELLASAEVGQGT